MQAGRIRCARARHAGIGLLGRSALLLLLCGGGASLAGAADGSIGGRVTCRKTPLAGAVVILIARTQAVTPARLSLTDEAGATSNAVILAAASPDAGAPAASSTMTDASGSYGFEALSAGDYLLEFEGRSGAGGRVREIHLAPGSSLRLDADLEPSRVERVVVRAGPEDAGPGVSRAVLGRAALASRPAALGDPFRALAGLAGIQPSNDFQSQMRLRGGEPAETSVLLDGMPLPYAYHFDGGAGSAGMISSDLVDAVQVSTGGFSAEYGDALAGVIDLSTRSARPDRIGGTVGLGSALQHAALSGPSGPGMWMLSGRYSDLGLYDGKVERPGAEGISFHDLFGAWRATLAGGARLDVALLESGSDYHAGFGPSESAVMSGRSRGLRAGLQIPLDATTLLRVQAADSSLEAESGVTGGESFDQTQGRQDLRLGFLRLLGGGHRLGAGLGVERTRGAMQGEVAGDSILIPRRTADGDDVTGLFVEDLWTIGGRLSLRYGLREERSSALGDDVLGPRLGLEVRAGDALLLRLAAGRFVQYPGQEQRFLATDDRLRAQIADHVIAGLERPLGGKARLMLEVYRKDLRNPVGETVNRAVDIPEQETRYDRGRVDGGEISLAGQPGGAWSWELIYGRLRATQTKDGVTTPRDTDQRQTLNLDVARRFGKGWVTGAALRAASGLPYTPLLPWTNGYEYDVVAGELNSARLPRYERLDLSLARHVSESWGGLQLRLDLINVLNRGNVRGVDLTWDEAAGVFYRTTSYQSPFLPVLSLSADF